ncbi:hypothetical protein [Campylobacter hyointestinalis]|uniref:hypothetical protein n=1 Tax=Campylobacter hyointestinalis TaxID=198 RepID=UPI000CE4D0F7|nr:hypothetical protein [Campylobacter hyointestinalis]PPB68387.1 hypothetical protein CDQ76_04505 [Campylobacter hyointestinalis subsp. hyointestinalis]TWO22306.1 hypothetical protein YZ80_02520 [Campylobacter hyointestinalis]
MKKIVLTVFALVFAAFALSGCVGTMLEPYDSNAEYGFRLDENKTSEILQNPENNTTKIFVFREKMLGLFVNYNLSVHYGVFNVSRPFEDKDQTVFIGYSELNFGSVTDITNTDKPATIYAATEAPTTIKFTPKPNLIYRIQSSVMFGWWIGRPDFTLLTKEKCLPFLLGDKYINSSNQAKWQKYKDIFWQKVNAKKYD